MKDTIARVLYPSLVLVVVLLFWQWGAERAMFPAYILPAPSLIGSRAAATIPLMFNHAVVTTTEIFCGFILALILGVMLAWMLAHVRVFEQAFYPWLVFVQVLPKVALGPLLVVWAELDFLRRCWSPFCSRSFRS